MDSSKNKTIVVVGGGFAGLNAAKSLAPSGHRIIVVDRANHHLFQPLLYQVATAGLSPADISAPIRSEFRGFPNVDVILDEVVEVLVKQKILRLKFGSELVFDYLVLATGATHGYFGNPDWEMLAPGLKTLEDAVEIRRRILSAFEKAEVEVDAEKRNALLSFVIVGGGPTGVEMAGAIIELARYALSEDYRHIQPEKTAVMLLEAGPKLLASFSEGLGHSAEEKLKKMGVKVLLNHKVTGLSENGVLIGSKIIPSRTVIWAAGVFASPLGEQLGVPCDRSGRVLVNQDLSIPGSPHIYVVGDLAAVKRTYAKGGNAWVPAMASGAMQQGRHAARNILNQIASKPTKDFVFFDKGSMATVGRTYAIAEIKNLRFSGILARLLWTVVHILYLISFRNRLLVLIQWMWSFVTFHRGARLITGDFARKFLERDIRP